MSSKRLSRKLNEFVDELRDEQQILFNYNSFDAADIVKSITDRLEKILDADKMIKLVKKATGVDMEEGDNE